MKAEIISIGDELLLGTTINTNASWMGIQLSNIGVEVIRVTTISDKKSVIIQAIQQAMNNASIVLITGGLGPTNDDITKHVLCELFETSLEFNAEAYKNVEDFITKRAGEMNQNNKSQAWLPKSCSMIPNYCGTASGMWFTKHNCHIISMPGVPFEMTSMMELSILPKLQTLYTLPSIVHRHILLSGIAEAKLAEIISPWEKQLPQVIKLAYLPSPGIIKLRLTCKLDNKQQALAIIKTEETKLYPYIQDYLFGFDNDSIEEIVGKLLIQNNATLCTAESCTAGNIARTLVSVPGSSQYFVGSIVAYSNTLKTNLLQIDEQIIKQYGAVSKEVVELMASQAKKICNTTYAIATSGIAGPSGGSSEKPVGTVWIAIASDNDVISQKYQFGENRERTITRSTITALHSLHKILK